MRVWQKLRMRVRSVFSRTDVERELNAELRFHLDEEIAANIQDGISPEEARLAALRALGGTTQIAEECRDARGLNWLEGLLQDLRYALRQLRRAPGFAVVVILMLALGIGANTAIFSLIDALLLKPLPVNEPHQLYELARGAADDYTFSVPIWREFQRQQNIFSGVFAYGAEPFDLSNGGEKDLV